MNALTRPNRNSLEPATLSEAMAFAGMLARSSMVPKDFAGRPENILVAIQWGREIGLGPLQALQNIALINGRPSVWGDAMIALVRGSGICAYVHETIEGEGDATTAICRVARKDQEGEIVGVFSVADAKKAGLWSKGGPWTQYPRRMLQMRARGFALRDGFPDVLRGVVSAEEAMDTPVDPIRAFAGQTVESHAEPTPEPAPPPPQAPRRTTRDLLNELRADLEAASTYDAVKAVLESKECVWAVNNFKNGAHDQLSALMQSAMDRVLPDESQMHIENDPMNDPALAAE